MAFRLTFKFQQTDAMGKKDLAKKVAPSLSEISIDVAVNYIFDNVDDRKAIEQLFAERTQLQSGDYQIEFVTVH